MPCNSSDGMVQGMSWDEQRRLRRVEAILCGVLRALGPTPEHARHVFMLVDWKEAGLSQEEAYKWWMDHVNRDKERKAP